jgi:hypothetical protein
MDDPLADESDIARPPEPVVLWPRQRKRRWAIATLVIIAVLVAVGPIQRYAFAIHFTRHAALYRAAVRAAESGAFKSDEYDDLVLTGRFASLATDGRVHKAQRERAWYFPRSIDSTARATVGYLYFAGGSAASIDDIEIDMRNPDGTMTTEFVKSRRKVASDWYYVEMSELS